MIHNNGGLVTDANLTSDSSGRRIYSNEFKLEVLKKVQEIGIPATAKLVSILREGFQCQTLPKFCHMADMSGPQLDLCVCICVYLALR